MTEEAAGEEEEAVEEVEKEAARGGGGRGEESSFVQKFFYKIIKVVVIWIATSSLGNPNYLIADNLDYLVIWITNPKGILNVVIWWGPFKLPVVWIDCQLPNAT